MSVHGKFNVPYFDSILKPARNLIPDYLPKYPDMERLWNQRHLQGCVCKGRDMTELL